MDASVLEQSVDRMRGVAGQSKGWLKFLGVLYIVSGALTALTVVGILFAWLPIWMGVLLFQAGTQAETAVLTRDPGGLITMMDKLRLFFVINGVVALIGLIFVGIALLATGGALFSVFEHMGPY